MSGAPSKSDITNVLRAPPHNYEAERALLGALLMNNRSYERVGDFLRPGHFADEANGRIYRAISALIEQGKQANPVTLKGFAESDELVGQAGGGGYLVMLLASVVTVINAVDYARLIYSDYLRRELIEIGQNIVNRAFDTAPDEEVSEQIESAERKLFNLTESNAEGGFRKLALAAREAVQKAEIAYKRDGALVGVNTGLSDINRRLGGLHPADLLILAGRPSMGKTALATTIAYNAAKACQAEGGVCAFFSLEMPDVQVANRVLGYLTNLDVQKIRNGQFAGSDIARLMQSTSSIDDLPLELDHTPALSVSAIRTRSRRLAKKYAKTGGLKLIVIDYLQLITTPRDERRENRVQEISAITSGLKALAKELNVPVLALSQLSRAVEQREDKRPQLSDLRESGTIEQDADVVMFVFREQYYLERSEPQGNDLAKLAAWNEKMARAQNVCEVIIAKQRQGPVGTERIHFEPTTTWLSNLSSIETNHGQ